MKLCESHFRFNRYRNPTRRPGFTLRIVNRRPMKVTALISYALVLFCLFLTDCNVTEAQLARLEWSGEQLPADTNTFLTLQGRSPLSSAPVISNDGTVLFQSRISTDGGGYTYGIFMIRDGEVKEVVREGDVTPDLNGNFGSFSGFAVADGGRVVFSSQLTGTLGGTTDNYGVYTYGPDGLTEIIRTGEDIPDLGGTVYFLVSMALNANGEVAGLAQTSGDDPFRPFYVVFRYTDGSLMSVAYSKELMPDGNGAIDLHPPALIAMNASGLVGFGADLMGSTNGSSWVLGVSDGTQVNIRARSTSRCPMETVISMEPTTKAGSWLLLSMIAAMSHSLPSWEARAEAWQTTMGFLSVPRKVSHNWCEKETWSRVGPADSRVPEIRGGWISTILVRLNSWRH